MGKHVFFLFCDSCVFHFKRVRNLLNNTISTSIKQIIEILLLNGKNLEIHLLHYKNMTDCPPSTKPTEYPLVGINHVCYHHENWLDFMTVCYMIQVHSQG